MKQVPTCEYFPFEAVRTNIEGAENIVRVIQEHRLPIETVVGVSTDKACKPVNVMGMTKAIQERIFIQGNMRCDGTRFVCVRYGNVLASRGSVIPLFHEQIRAGGPVTITTLEMTRFLLTLEDAVDTVFAAIAEANPRDTEVPVVSNVDALAHDDGAKWSSLLSAQLSSPVRWKHCLITLDELGVHDFVELGPGGVLTGMAKRTVDGARTISVATPEELDKLIEWVNAGAPWVDTQHEGEHLFAVERLVVSPAAGPFTPIGGIGNGDVVEVGTVLGHVGDIEVRSAFDGVVQSYIAVDGERVTLRQPIAWLRTV